MRLKMKPHNTKGFLITFCGLDGCGKSSMIKHLTEELSNDGIEYIVTKQPTDFIRKSDIFRTYMDNPNHSKYEYRALSLMAAADRIQHCKKTILSALKEGKVVICDRYFYSCLANLRARGYSKDKWIYEISKEIPKPDLSFFLDVPVDIAIDRVRQRPEEKDRYIDISLQHKLLEEYKKICKENKGIALASDKSEEETFLEVSKNLNKLYGG